MERVQTSLLFPVFTSEGVWPKKNTQQTSHLEGASCKKSDLVNRKGKITGKYIFSNFKRIKIEFKAIKYCLVL